MGHRGRPRYIYLTSASAMMVDAGNHFQDHKYSEHLPLQLQEVEQPITSQELC